MKIRKAYLIFVRPPGSQIWTQHWKGCLYNEDIANGIADNIALEGKYCSKVIEIELPREIDEYLYSQHADGDVKFVVASDTGVC